MKNSLWHDNYTGQNLFEDWFGKYPKYKNPSKGKVRNGSGQTPKLNPSKGKVRNGSGQIPKLNLS